MTNKALVIQNIQSLTFDSNAFMSTRSLVAEYCYNRLSALSAIKTKRYRCVVVSMDMVREDPIEIISSLRHVETELGLSPTQILVVSGPRQATHAEMAQFNISAQIRSHQLK